MRTAVATPVTNNKKGRRSASEWRALMRAFTHSGETRIQFCERHGVALNACAGSGLVSCLLRVRGMTPQEPFAVTVIFINRGLGITTGGQAVKSASELLS